MMLVGECWVLAWLETVHMVEVVVCYMRLLGQKREECKEVMFEGEKKKKVVYMGFAFQPLY